MAPRRAGWIGGAVFVIVLVFVGTWFLAASPRFESAAETLAMAEEARSRNEILELQLIQLRADFARMDEYRAELEASQIEIPTEALLDELVATIYDNAVTNDVDVVEVSPGTPVVVMFAAPLPSAAEPAPPDETDEPDADASADGAEEPTQPSAPTIPQIEGLVAVPIMVKVLGGYANTLGFLESYQTKYPRLLLVTEWTAARQTTAEAASGKRATADGDVELEIHGYAYVLVNPVVQAIAEDDEASEPEIGPLPGSDRNPFIPLVPTAL